MSTTSPELLIELDRSRTRGLRVQIEDALRAAIRSGRLAPGTALPSSRALATDLSVTRGVVVSAYDQLISEGYLVSRHGSGTVVNATAPDVAPRSRADPSPTPALVDFRPGLPDLDLFPRAAWLRASRAALQTMPRDDLGYTDPLGLPRLRQALVEYVSRVRGISAHADQVMICNGFGHGFSLVARVLRDRGHQVIAVEDPGYDEPRHTLASLGMSYRAIPVDEQGLDVGRLRRSKARAVVVTPAHQNPTGVVLSPTRRTELLAWARDVDGYVIEDDYDAEYRYDRHPTGAVQGLDPDRVISCGTTSKALAPGLRLGWIVLPRALVDLVVEARMTTDRATSSIVQATFAEFLGSGDLDRHLRRSRRVYRHRRDAMIAALGTWFPDAVPQGASAGLHVLVTLPPGLDEHELAAGALEHGVRVYPLDEFRTRRRPDLPGALVLGYGWLTPELSEHGARVLGEVAARLR
jgi:GntR family transcriptional regulator/MocR family aminotransferase